MENNKKDIQEIRSPKILDKLNRYSCDHSEEYDDCVIRNGHACTEDCENGLECPTCWYNPIDFILAPSGLDKRRFDKMTLQEIEDHHKKLQDFINGK